MATIEQAPPQLDVPDTPGVLNNLLARAYTLNWEAIFYVTVFAVAVLTRFIGLGDRVMSHDESLHVTYSFNLWKKGEFVHTPLMHGPVLFHMTALMFFLFGDNDFTGRLYPAILGIIIVLMPKLLFERWLGKRGAMVTSILLLISPMVLYHSRYIREDIPSIFYTLLMVYAIFAYLDGVRPKQVRWLIVLSAATLLSLGTKEVSFMYIAIFGLFLTLFWLFQVAQGARAGLTRPLIGRVIGIAVGVLAAGGIAYEVGNAIAPKLFESGGAQISSLVIAVPVFIVLVVVGLLLFAPLRYLLARIALEGNSLFRLLIAGFILGTVGALAMTCFMNIAPVDVKAGLGTVLSSRLILWTGLMVIILLAVIVITAAVRFEGGSRLPWRDIVLLTALTAAVCIVLTFLEERTRSITQTPPPAGHNEWIVLAWLVSGALVVGVLFLRFSTTFFQEMKRYPVFDILIVLGTLILPWVSALPIYLAGYPLDESSPSAGTITAGIFGTVPLIIAAIIIGLCWNPKVWLACAATFYSIFAFFFTTIFTNVNGLFTGMVGSLGYWLAQQGVRRGSQPQYYYLLVELPIYEYLPVIGASIAGIAGMLGLWRFRSARLAEKRALEDAELQALDMQAQAEAEGLEPAGDGSVQASPEMAVTQISAMNETALNRQAELAEQPAPTESPAPVEYAEPKIHDVSEVFSEGDAEKPKRDQMFELVDDGELVPIEEVPVIDEEAARRTIPEAEWLDRPPFLAFVGFWGLLILMAFTMAGEKMPWLTTHLTIPFILLTGWYLGTHLDKVDWQVFAHNRGWALLGLSPLFLISFVNVIGPFFLGNLPFGGLERTDLLRTFTWFGAVLLAVTVAAGVVWVWRRIGTAQTVRVAGLGFFALLGVLTFRTAWTAAYINYDYATEFLVYAHGAPANKIVMNTIEDISRRSTDGLKLKVAYDDKVSWPGSWYFRNYTDGSFKGDMSGFTDVENYDAIVVGVDNDPKIASQTADKFYKIKYSRLWWPMQDYFGLTPERIDHLFSAYTYTDKDQQVHNVAPGELARAVWDIWWNRNYTTYSAATGGNFEVSNWPVADWMYFYVRKDIAAQIWTFGTGTTRVQPLPEDAFKNLRCDTCAADLVFAGQGDQAGQLNHPRGMTVGPDGKLYVVDSQNARISIFDAQGKFISSFGTPSTTDPNSQTVPPGGTFREPWGVAVGKDGRIYVADTWNHRVQVFDNKGTLLKMWGEYEQLSPGQTGKPTGFWGPRDIAVDNQNNVYVADTGNKRIRVYDSTGKHLRDIGQGGAAVGQLSEPVGLAINPETSELFVADTWNRRIEVYALDGTYRRSWNLQAWAAATDSGNRPYLALDRSLTHLYVTDPDTARVLVFDLNGSPILSFGSLGSGTSFSASQLGVLGGITVDQTNQLFLADTQTGRILRFPLDALPGLIPAPAQNNSQVQPGQSGSPQIGTQPATSDVF